MAINRRSSIRSSFIKCSITSVCALLLVSAAAHRGTAATFPARGDDTMSSMGVFRVAVSPPFRSLLDPAVALNGYPGYQPADGRLTSPLLIDRTTAVGRSDPYNRPLVGSVDVGVPSMGLQGYGDYPITPFIFGGAPAGTREILTRIRDLELRTRAEGCSNNDPRVPFVPIDHRMVYAGPAQGIVRKSVGIVQERVNNGAADPDFPARSFFDIFVEVNLPPVPGTVSAGTFPPVGAILYNDFPLVITNENLMSLPPQVIYIHGETTAVPLKFRDSNPPHWNADDVFGYLVLAGHGTQIDCSSAAAVSGFLNTVLGPIGGAPANEMPIEWPFPTDTCPPPNAAYDSVKVVDVIEFRAPTGFRVLGRNFSHTRLDNPIVPPPVGGTATYSDAATQVDLEFSTDNGGTWLPAQAMGGVSASIRNAGNSGDVRTFDTEMLSLNLSGNSPAGPFRLRESPTRASTGKHTIRDTGGPFLIASFFDVFLELSIDNGQTWLPADRPIRVQLLEPCETAPPQVVNVTPDCDLNTITIQFSESMDPVSTTDAGKYTLGVGGSVLGVSLNAAGNVATLHTTDLLCDGRYTLVIRSVEDKCGNAIAPNPTTLTFVCPPCKVSKWSQLPGFLVFSAPQGHGGDRPSDFDWATLMESGGTIEPNMLIAEDFRSDGRPILCVRWWGSYMPGFEPSVTANSFFEDGYVLSFFTDFRVAGAASRPDRLLGTYVAPLEAVKITPTDFVGCDRARIWQYEVRLEDTCLEHAEPDIARPNAFLERSNVVYWVAIAAEVGHRVIPLINADGTVVKWESEPSGKRAEKHFWGWHTSPRQREDISVNGRTLMQGTNWVYPPTQWRLNEAFCNEIDQAFELLTFSPPCETDPPTVISVQVDCDKDVIIVTYSEAMDPLTAGNIGNYSLGGATITSVTLNAAGDQATLTVDDLKCGGVYVLSIRSVEDLCKNVIVPNPYVRDLVCPPCPEPKVSKWSQLPGFLVGTAATQGRGFDRPSDFDWTTLMHSGTQFLPPNAVVAEDFRSDGRPILCVRWWGSYMPGFEPSFGATIAALPPVFFEDGYVLSFFSDIRPTGAPSRPDRLLGTYVAPLRAVKITPTHFIACDTNRIWQYEVRLEDTCLEHAEPDIATPRAFLERSNIVYWVAITAEVGMRVVPTTDPAGDVIWRQELTGKRADRHFWGWHTSPIQREDRSVNGHVLMQSTNWIYPSALWIPNPPICNEIDQAFELLTTQPPCETNPPTVISVTADCDSNRVTVVYSEPMDPVTTGNVGNYSIVPAVGIISVTLNAVGDTATLLTGDLLCGNTYTLTVRGVRDLCTNTIFPNPQSVTFVCPPCPEVKTSKWSQLPGYRVFPTNPHRRGYDRPSDFDWALLMQPGGVIVQPNAIVADDFISDGRPILCVRWWGSYMRGYEPTTAGAATGQFFEDAYVLSFFSGFIGGINRPEKLLGTYVAPIQSVHVTPTQFYGCDSNRIYQYEVELKDTCLDHRFASIARPSAFLERSNGYYFLSISAEVGHRVIPLRNNHGVIVDWVQEPTGKRAQEHFWGWHTAESNRLDVSVTGNVRMQGMDWLYGNWVRNPEICNDIDQAFELLTGRLNCPNPPILSIVRDNNNVVLSWVGGGFILQATPALTNPAEAITWTDMVATSPVTLPIVFSQNMFFRLICP